MRLRAAALLLCASSVTLAAPADPVALDRELSATETMRRIRAARELVGLDAQVARPLVRRALGDVDLDVRVAATQAAGQLDLVELAPLLLERASSPEPRLREVTLVALGALRALDPTAQRGVEAALERALADAEPAVRAAALRAIGERPPPPSRGALIEALGAALGDERPELRRAAAEALEHLDDRGTLHALAAHVDDSSPEVRIAIARALGTLGDTRAAPAVLRIVDDANEDARAAAIAALGTLAAPAAASRLIAVLARPRYSLAGLAAVALGRIAGGGSVSEDATEVALRARAGDALVSAVRGDQNRAAALEGLRASGPAAASLLAPLLPALGARPADPILLIATELAAAGDERVARRLLDGARIATDGRFDAALTAARPGAGPVRDAVVVWLAARLGDPGAAARRAAADALGALGDPRATRALEAAASDADPAARRAALSALARTSSTAEPRLIEAARGADAELARVALTALGKRHDEPARQALAAALGAESAAVRDAAALGLSDDTGAGSVVGSLLGALKTGRKDAREAVALALSGPLRGRPDAIARELCLSLAAGDEPGAAGALELLGAMRDRGAAERLAALAPKLARRPLRRARLYAVLGDLLLGGNDATSVRALLGGLDDPEPGVRATAAWALGKRGKTTPADPIVKALSARLADPSGPVRANALAALARLGNPPQGATLARLAIDLELAARINALRLGATVIASRTDPHAWVARAEQARGAPARPGADYVLLRLVDDAASAPRIAAVRIGLPDGLVEIAVLDERGIVRDEGTPPGTVLVDADPSLLR